MVDRQGAGELIRDERPCVVLTQDAVAAAPVAAELRAAGFETLHWPLVRLTPAADEAIAPWLRRLGRHSVVVLPSPSAVRLVAAALRRLRLVWPADLPVGLIGPGSAGAFDACFGAGLPRRMPAGDPADGDHLAEVLIGAAADGDAPILILNRPDGGTAWVERLRRAGLPVEVVTAYQAEPVADPPPAFDVALAALRSRGRPVVWLIGSVAGFETLDRWLRSLPDELAGWVRSLPCEVPHPRVASGARSFGFADVRVRDPQRPLVERLQYLRPPAAAAMVPAPPPAGDAAGDGRLPDPVDGDGQAPRTHLSAPSHLSAEPNPDKADAAQAAAPDASSPPGSDRSRPAEPGTPSPVSPAAGRSSPTAPPPLPPPAAADRPRSALAGLWPLAILLVVGVVAVVGWWFAQQRFLAVERDSARRLQDADARAARLEEQLRGLRDAQAQLTTRSKTLETKIAESASQQEQLQALYDDIARSRGESALSEVEESIVLASQHLELTGNVQAALLALEAAEKRLGGSDVSPAIGVRRLLLQDIEKLRALPEVDIARLAARLDDVINRVDRLPLLADASAAAAAAPAPAPAAPAAGAGGAAAGEGATAGGAAAGEPPSALERLTASVRDASRRGFEAVRDEFRSLVTIRRIDRPDGLLMSPDQKLIARDNLRLLLLNARLNLINRQEGLFRQDMARVLDVLKRLFDTEQADVKSTIATLELLQTQPLVVALPSLAETVAAIRAARASSEKRS